MKIFVIKKYYLFNFSIIMLIILFSILYLNNFDIINTTKEVSNDMIDFNSFQNKIADLPKQKDKIAYLTFDDGPTLKSTGKILDILAEEDVKATFFVVGKHVKEHPELVKRAFEEGHYIANHGYSHNNKKLYASSYDFLNEIKSTDLEISKALGIENYTSHLFRFPNGYMSPNYKYAKKEYVKLLSSIGYTYIDWNCLNKDSESKYSNYQLLENLKNSSKNKGTLIILMHDTSDVNKTDLVLKDSINYLKEQGYIFQNFYSFLDNKNHMYKSQN